MTNHTIERVALIDFLNRTGDVRQFADDTITNRNNTGEQADHGNRRQQNQFRGDNETSFVISQPLQNHHGFTLSKNGTRQNTKTVKFLIHTTWKR